MHPNDSESFTGGVGGPSDPALVGGGQGRSGDGLIRDANVVGKAALVVAVVLGTVALLALVDWITPDWLLANSVIMPIWANWPRCVTPGCERYALTDDLCRDCACEAYASETVEVAS